MPSLDANTLLRGLPPVQRLLEHATSSVLTAQYGRDPVTAALRIALGQLRDQIQAGFIAAVPPDQALLARAGEWLAERRRPGLRRVINATGIVLHTGLGRAPLAAQAVKAVAAASGGYCNLEFDLATGRRGMRTGSVEALLRELTGAEAAVAVNNGAAAILLALSAVAGDGEVIVSRGELVEIGGGFRIPDVIRQGGARLVEVGATNRTSADDYRAGIGPNTRVLLKVHQSNFRIIGFTEAACIAELSAIARENGLLVVADLGSGLLAPTPGVNEPTLGDALSDGADLVTCSGDKLLGGPQAGLVLGKAAAIDQLRRHPLLRAVRLDKMSLAALEATLMLHRDTPDQIPVRRMLAQGDAVLAVRAMTLAGMLGQGEVVATEGYAGGGALPDERLPSRAVALRLGCGVEAAAARLRLHDPAVVGRIVDGRLLLDMLTVMDEDLPDLAAAVATLA